MTSAGTRQTSQGQRQPSPHPCPSRQVSAGCGPRAGRRAVSIFTPHVPRPGEGAGLGRGTSASSALRGTGGPLGSGLTRLPGTVLGSAAPARWSVGTRRGRVYLQRYRTTLGPWVTGKGRDWEQRASRDAVSASFPGMAFAGTHGVAPLPLPVLTSPSPFGGVLVPRPLSLSLGTLAWRPCE